MMDALKKSQKFQSLLKKFAPDKKSNNDQTKSNRANVKTTAATESSSSRRGQEQNKPRPKTRDAPSLETSVRKSARDVKKPQRYDPSPKVNGSRTFLKSRAEIPTLRAPKPAKASQRQGVIEEDDDEFLSASMVTPGSPPHRSAFSRVTRPKPPDPVIELEPDGRRGNRQRSHVPRANYPELNGTHRDEPTFERDYGYNGFRRIPENARRQNGPSDLYHTIRQPVVQLNDIRRTRPELHSTHLADALQVTRGSAWGAPPRRDHSTTMRLIDLAQNRNDSLWAVPALRSETHSSTMRLTDMAQSRNDSLWAPPPPPVLIRRDDGFLRPATPPNAFEIVAKQEQSQYLDVLEDFAHCSYLSAIEIVHFLNKIVEKLELKIAKGVQQKQANQSILKGSVCDSTRIYHKDAMIESWLRSNTAAPQPPNVSVNPKRNAPDYREVEAKRRRFDTENQMLRRPRDTPAPGRLGTDKNMSYSLLKRREDRRRLDRSSPTSHFDS